jgi:hypothetical protein
MGNGRGITECNGVRVGEGGVTRMLPGGDVVPLFAQLSAQHNFASATSGVCCCRSAALQQSMSIMRMPHSLSPECSGIPAKAPPTSTSNRNKDASRFFMREPLYEKALILVNFSIAHCLKRISDMRLHQTRARFMPRDLRTFSPNWISDCANSRGAAAESRVKALV